MGRKQRLETDENSSMKRKTWQVYSFGKRYVLRFDLKESREDSTRLNPTSQKEYSWLTQPDFSNIPG